MLFEITKTLGGVSIFKFNSLNVRDRRKVYILTFQSEGDMQKSYSLLKMFLFSHFYGFMDFYVNIYMVKSKYYRNVWHHDKMTRFVVKVYHINTELHKIRVNEPEKF